MLKKLSKSSIPRGMPLLLRNGLTRMGQFVFERFIHFGRFVLFFARTMKGMLQLRQSYQIFLEQLDSVGSRSSFIIMLAGASTGLIFGVHFSDLFKSYSAEGLLGAAATLTLSKEIAPVLGAFIVVGRTGSAMAADMAQMRINQELDALNLMGVNPISYFVAPRVLATTIMLPLLVVWFIGVSLVCTYVMGVLFFQVDAGVFFDKIPWLAKPDDLISGLIKSSIFGFILSIVGCYKGFNAKRSTKGVGQATASAVTTSLSVILITDYTISWLQTLMF
ncbi:MAG: ABC transporter permease [Proteobacteria bacterium]|nr:ABC transporter permease [Pseudomonadota bacterium]